MNKLSVFICYLLLVSIKIFSQDITPETKKIFEILKSKPAPGYLFDRFYNAWMDSSDVKGLEDFLKKNIADNPNSESRLLLAFFYQKEGQINDALVVFHNMENEKLLNADMIYYWSKLELLALNLDFASKQVDKALALTQKNELKLNLIKLKAQIQVRSGDLTAAQKTLADFTIANAKDINTLEDILEVQSSEGLHIDAKETCKKLIELATDNFEKINYQLKLGAVLKKLEEKDAAERLYLDLLKLSGEDSWLSKEALYQFETLYRSKDNLDGLLKKYEELLTNDSKNLQLQKRYAALLIEKGEKEKPLAIYKTLTELLPGDQTIKIEYVNLLITNNKTADALQLLHSMKSNASGSIDYDTLFRIAELESKNKNASKAKEAIQNFVNRPSISEFEILRMATVIEKNDSIENAITFLEEQSNKKPEFSGLKESLIEMYLQKDNHEKAIEIADKLKLTDDVDLNIQIANLFAKKAKLKEAVFIIEKLNPELKKSFKVNIRQYEIHSDLKDDKKTEFFLNELINSCSNKNETQEIIKVLSKEKQNQLFKTVLLNLSNKNTKDNQSLILIANMKNILGEKDEALKILDEINTNIDGNTATLEMVSDLYLNMKVGEKVIEIVDKLIKKSPKDSSKYLQTKINALLQTYKYNEALEASKQLISLPEAKIEDFSTFADIASYSGDYQVAIDQIRKGINKYPDEKSLKVKLAQFYSYNGNYKDARRIIWSAIETETQTSEKLSLFNNLIGYYEYDIGTDALVETLLERKKNAGQNSFPLLALITLSMRTNDIDSRTKYMIELAKMKSDDPDTLLQLSEVLVLDLNYEGAENALLKAKEIGKKEKYKNKLIEFYFKTGKEEKAFSLLTDTVKGTLKETDLISIVENLFIAKKFDEAYSLLKNNKPKDESHLYLLYLAICAKEAKKEETLDLCLKILEIKKEFAIPQNIQNSRSYYHEDTMPEVIMTLHNTIYGMYYINTGQQNLKGSRRNRGRSVTTNVSNILNLPTTLSQLHGYARALIIDIYQNATDEAKNNIAQQMTARGQKYTDIILCINKKNFQNIKAIYNDIKSKYPDKQEVTILGLIYDTKPLTPDEFIEVLKKAQEFSSTFALSIAYSYQTRVKDSDQKVLDACMKVINETNQTIEEKLYSTLYFYSNIIYQQKDELKKKVKEDFPPLYLKNKEALLKNQNNEQQLSALLVYSELWPEFIELVNKSQAPKNPYYYRQNYNYGNYFDQLMYPQYIYSKINYTISNVFQNNIFNINKSILDHLSKCENIYIKLLVYNKLNEAEKELQTIEELIKSADYENIIIALTYFKSKLQIIEAMECIQKALTLPLKIENKKSLNLLMLHFAQIPESASAVDKTKPLVETNSQMQKIPEEIKTQNIRDAIKRLQNMVLDKNDMKLISDALLAIGDEKEASKLIDKAASIKTVNSYRNYQRANPDDLKKRVDALLISEKKDSAYKLFFSEMKPLIYTYFYETENYGMNWWHFPEILKKIDKTALKDDFIKFLKENVKSNTEDLLIAALISNFYNDTKTCKEFLSKLIEAKPNEVVSQILYYAYTFDENPTPSEALIKECAKKYNICHTTIIKLLSLDQQVSQRYFFDFKELILKSLDLVKDEDLEPEQSYYNQNSIFNLIINNSRISKNNSGYSIIRPLKLQKQDGNKDDAYKAEFEKFTLDYLKKCIDKKIQIHQASKCFAHFCISNKVKIEESYFEKLMAASDKPNQNSNMFYSSGSNSILPLELSIIIAMKQDDNLKAFQDKITKGQHSQREIFLKKIEILKKLCGTDKVNREDLFELQDFNQSYNRANQPTIDFTLIQVLKLIDGNPDTLSESFESDIKNHFKSQSYINTEAYSDLLNLYLEKRKNEEKTSFLLALENKILEKPITEKEFKNEKNYESVAQKAKNIFLNNLYDKNFDYVNALLDASTKSDFYFNLTRTKNYFSINTHKITAKQFTESGFFKGDLKDLNMITINDTDSVRPIIFELLSNYKEQDKKEIATTLNIASQTDGVKIILRYLKDKNANFLPDYLATREEDFKKLSIKMQLEWSNFLLNNKNIDLTKTSPEGKKFLEYVTSISAPQSAEALQELISENLNNRYSSYGYLSQVKKILNAIVEQPEEKAVDCIVKLYNKYKYIKNREKVENNFNNYNNYNDRNPDEFINCFTTLKNTNKSVLIALCNIFAANPNIQFDTYGNINSCITNYYRTHITKQLENLKSNEANNKLENKKRIINEAFAEVEALTDKKIIVYINFSLLNLDSKKLLTSDEFNLIVNEWVISDNSPLFKKSIIAEQKYREQDIDKYFQYFKSLLEDEKIPLYYKKTVISLNKGEAKQEQLKQWFEFDLKILKQQGNREINKISNLYDYIENYPYETLITQIEDVKLFAQNWAKAMLSNNNDDDYKNRPDYYNLKNRSKNKFATTLFKILNVSIDEKQLNKIISIPELNFFTSVELIPQFIEEGFEDYLVEKLPKVLFKNIEINTYDFSKNSINEKILEKLPNFLNKFSDEKTRIILNLIILRFGEEEGKKGKKNYKKFEMAIKDYCTKDVDDFTNRLVIKLLPGTTLINDKAVLKVFANQTKEITEKPLNKLPPHLTSIYVSMNSSQIFQEYFYKDFAIYNNKLEKLLNDIKNSEAVDESIATIIEDVIENIQLNNITTEQAKNIQQTIVILLTSLSHTQDKGKESFNFASSLLYLLDKGKEWQALEASLENQHLYHWKKQLNLETTINIFRECYNSKDFSKEKVVSSLLDMLGGNMKEYFDPAKAKNIKEPFNFINDEKAIKELNLKLTEIQSQKGGTNE